VRILAVSGSLRRESHNSGLLRTAAELAPAGIEVVRFDGLREVPPYDEDWDVEPALEPVHRLRAAVADADALFFATPEYNSSIPGQLKNAVDWLSRPFPDNVLRNRPVAVVGASTGQFGAAWAQAELRKVLGAAGARVLEEGVALPRAGEAFDGDGRLRSERVREQIRQILDALMRQTAPQHAAV
jgi:chromate reductase, NAD(P)H dehydrogenase (quinone)